MDGELTADVDSAVALQPASSIPLSEAALRKALGTLGSNSLSLQSLDLSHLDLSAGKSVDYHLPWLYAKGFACAYEPFIHSMDRCLSRVIAALSQVIEARHALALLSCRA